jgi:2-phospho-L-lactate guanylyltransferase
MAAADLHRTWALVPIRGLESAKSRLGGALDAEERLALVSELLRRTLVATRDAPSVTGTVVVTMDPEAAAIASEHGAVGLVERAPGLDAAIRAARSVAAARGATAVVILPADLPAITSRALETLLATARRELAGASAPTGEPPAGLVALVPDRHGRGTNALLVSPPDGIEPAFGEGSRARHAAAARAAGARYLELAGALTLDIDEPDDLLFAEAAPARVPTEPRHD